MNEPNIELIKQTLHERNYSDLHVAARKAIETLQSDIQKLCSYIVLDRYESLNIELFEEVQNTILSKYGFELSEDGFYDIIKKANT